VFAAPWEGIITPALNSMLDSGLRLVTVMESKSSSWILGSDTVVMGDEKPLTGSRSEK
jgi:hypothetical protein